MRSSPFYRWEFFLLANRKRLTRGLLVLTALTSLLLFSARVSEGGDDSNYIYAASKYARSAWHYSYGYNAPLYPLFLSIFVRLFGLKVILLKLVSVILYFFSFYFFLRAFEKRVPYLVLLPALLFYALNAKLQYYASQTYNEALFLFLQSLLLYVFFRRLDKELLVSWKSWLACGVLVTLLSLVKNLGVAAFPAILLYFLYRRQWKNAGYFAGMAAGTRLLYEGVARLTGSSASQFSAQASMFLKKSAYGAEGPNEDLRGMAARFFGNCNLYFSRRLPQVLSFQEEGSRVQYPHYLTVTISAVVGLLLLAAVLTAFRSRNRFLLFAVFFTGGAVAATFLVVQVSWGQARFLVIHMPVLLLIAMYALWKWCGQVRWRNYFYLLVLAVLCGSWALTSVKRMLFTVPELVEQARGNAYAGFTPDWQHFLAMSRWCAEHLPPDAVVASRKAGMSFIYSGGKEFFSINNVLFPDPGTGQSDPDQVLAFLEKNNVRYVIVPSLRYNPEVNDGLTINTMTLLLMGVVNRYPDRVKFVHREGGEEDEPAWLYEIVY